MSGALEAVRLRAVERLVPPARRGRRSRALRVALAAAVLLHVLLGTAAVYRPAWLFPAPKPHKPPPQQVAPPREAEIELVQNAAPTTADAPVGGSGRTLVHTVPVPPPRQQQAARKVPRRLSAVAGEKGELPLPAPPQPAQPATGRLVPQPHQAAPPQPSEPVIRLSDFGDSEGLAGGSNTDPGTPDPNAHNKLPPFPVEAARRGERGTVYMMVRVRPDGSAGSVVVVRSSGWADLDSAAVAALQTWRFKPAVAHGVKVESDVPVSINWD